MKETRGPGNMNCNHERLVGFLSNQLDIEEKLDFLFHLEECGRCWDGLYVAVKAQHPHFYRSATRRVKISEREMGGLDILGAAVEEEEEEEVFEVA